MNTPSIASRRWLDDPVDRYARPAGLVVLYGAQMFVLFGPFPVRDNVPELSWLTDWLGRALVVSMMFYLLVVLFGLVLDTTFKRRP